MIIGIQEKIVGNNNDKINITEQLRNELNSLLNFQLLLKNLSEFETVLKSR